MNPNAYQKVMNFLRDPEASNKYSKWLDERPSITSFPQAENIFLKAPAKAMGSMVLGDPERKREAARVSKLPINHPDRRKYELELATRLVTGYVGDVQAVPGISKQIITQAARPLISSDILRKIRVKERLTPEEMKILSKSGLSIERLNELFSGRMVPGSRLKNDMNTMLKAHPENTYFQQNSPRATPQLNKLQYGISESNNTFGKK